MRSTLKNSFYGALGFILPLVVTLFTAPYIVHKLTPEVYGIYILSTTLIGLMSFMDLGFGQGIIKFVSEYEAKKDFESIRDVIGVSAFIYFMMGIVGAIIIFIFANDLASLFKVNEEYKDLAQYVFKVTAIGFFINFIINIFSPIPKALQRYDISTKVETGVLLLVNLSIVGLLYLGYGLKEVIITSLFFSLIKGGIYFFIYKKLLPGIPFKPKFKRDIFKKIFSFSFFTAINGITGNLVFRVDKMIIGSFLGTAAVTYYTIPFMMIQMGFSLIASATQFIFPATSNLYSLGLREEIIKIYRKATRYTAAISSLFSAGFVTLGGPFLTLWMGADFAKNSESLIPIIAIVFFFHSVSVPAFYIYNGLGLSKVNMISSLVGSCAYLVAAMIFIPKFKLIGAAISFSFTLLPFPFYFYYLHRQIGEENNYLYLLLLKSTLTMTIVCFTLFIFDNILKMPLLLVSFIVNSTLLIIISFGVLILLRLIKWEELLSILNKVRREVT